MVKISRVGNWLFACLLSFGLCCTGCSQKATLDEQIQQNFEHGNWETTLTLCEQKLQEQMNNTEVLTLRGRAYIATGQLRKAIADLTRVIELQPDDPEAYYHREIAYRRAGEIELATADGRRGRELDALYKSAYAYEPSNFISPRSFKSTTTRSESTYDEPIYADEASFEAEDETSRLLAEDTGTEPTENQTLESRVGQDVVLPRAPQVDRSNVIPNLTGFDKDKSDEADGQTDAGGEIVGIEDIQFPPQPLPDKPNDSDFPDIDNPLANPPPQISTSLPVGPVGNLFIPGAAPPGIVGTGLPTARTYGGASGTSSLHRPYTPYGLSGLPLPTNSTGLPVSTPLTTGQPVDPLIPAGQQTQFHANPIYTPGQRPTPQLSNVVPSRKSPNPLLNQPAPPSTAPATPAPISTALPDTVLENKLVPTPASRPATPSYRSIQP